MHILPEPIATFQPQTDTTQTLPGTRYGSAHVHLLLPQITVSDTRIDCQSRHMQARKAPAKTSLTATAHTPLSMFQPKQYTTYIWHLATCEWCAFGWNTDNGVGAVAIRKGFAGAFSCLHMT